MWSSTENTTWSASKFDFSKKTISKHLYWRVEIVCSRLLLFFPSLFQIWNWPVDIDLGMDINVELLLVPCTSLVYTTLLLPDEHAICNSLMWCQKVCTLLSNRTGPSCCNRDHLAGLVKSLENIHKVERIQHSAEP